MISATLVDSMERVRLALRDAGPRGLRVRDFAQAPTVDGGPIIEHVPRVLWALEDDGVAIVQDNGTRFWLQHFEPKGRPNLHRARLVEPTGVDAGFMRVQACKGCQAVRPWRSVCEHGFAARPCLIDPDLNGPAPCQLEERRAVLAWLRDREVQRAA